MTLEPFLRRIVAIVDEVGIPYMLTGSLASAYYGEPRATRDIDFVIVVSDVELDQLVRSLDEDGLYVSPDAAREARQERSQFNAIDPESGWKVDWIIRKDRPFSRREFERRQRVEFLELELPMVTCEDLIVAKLEWAEKGGSELQLRDALAILLQQGPELDREHIERWVDDLGLEDLWRALLGEARRISESEAPGDIDRGPGSIW